MPEYPLPHLILKPHSAWLCRATDAMRPRREAFLNQIPARGSAPPNTEAGQSLSQSDNPSHEPNMNRPQEPKDLGSLLDLLEQAGTEDEPVSIDCMLQATGHRSFGALLLVPGLLVFSPLSGIPGLPSIFAVIITLIAVQLLVGRRHIWLPDWLLKRTASRSKYDRAMAFLKRPSKYIDRLLRQRLTFL